MAKVKQIEVTLVRSPIGTLKNQKDTLKALGLSKIHQTVTKVDNDSIRGMIRTVAHLVSVKE